MDDALSMTRAAELLGITQKTLRAMVRDGKLPTVAHPTDKRVKLIPREALEAYVSHLPGGPGAARAPTPSLPPQQSFAGLLVQIIDEAHLSPRQQATAERLILGTARVITRVLAEEAAD